MRRVVARPAWDAAAEACPACGDVVDRRLPHCQVELGRKRPESEGRKLTHERRLLAFCNEACADAWLDDMDR